MMTFLEGRRPMALVESLLVLSLIGLVVFVIRLIRVRLHFKTLQSQGLVSFSERKHLQELY